MRLSSLLLIFSSTAFIGLGWHAVASDRKYDRSIENTVLKKLKTRMTADLRGSIDYQNRLWPSPSLLASEEKKPQLPSATATPQTEQARSKPEPIVENKLVEDFGIDRTTTASISKPKTIVIWDRFDKDGNYIDPYTPGR